MHGLMFGGMHGLMFGGFHSSNYYDDDDSSNQKPYGLYIPDYYRSFGNHRIATHLRKQGWDIECLDYMYMFSYDELVSYVDKRITKETVFIGVSVIFMLDYSNTETFRKLMKYIRENYSWVKFIVGGVKSYCITCIPDADYYIAGNGEYAIESVLRYIMGRGEKPKTKIVSDTGVEIIDAIKDYPCYPKRDANISYEERDFIKPYETLNVELGRGCRFKCKYCSFPLLGLKGNMMRDEDSVYEELKENYEKWGVWNYYFTDDTVNDSKEKMKMLSNAVDKLSFQPQFNGYARADLLIRHGKETWDDMINAGFTSHSYGVESFNHESAKVMGKGMHPEEMKEGLLKIEEYFNAKSPYFYTGSMTMIAGLPFETFESLDNTKEWLNKYWSNHTVAYLPLFLQPDNGGVIDEIDENITSNFMDYGYTFEENPIIMNKNLSKAIDKNSEARKFNKNKQFTLNYWVHPSGDYDWSDAIEWVEDFIYTRNILGYRPTYCFQGSTIVMKEHETPKNLKEYYKADSKRHTLDDRKIFGEFVNKYKQEKLTYR